MDYDTDSLIFTKDDSAAQVSSDPEWKYVPIRRTQTEASGESIIDIVTDDLDGIPSGGGAGSELQADDLL